MANSSFGIHDALNQAMDSRLRGNDDTTGVTVVVGGSDGSRSIMTSFPRLHPRGQALRKRESITASHDVIPAQAGIHYRQRIPKLEMVNLDSGG